MNNELQARLDFMDFGARQRGRLGKMQVTLNKMVDRALDRFYGKVRTTPETAAFFNGEAHMAGAKRAQATHWSRITSGNFDEGFYESVRRIGSVHARIGLEPRWYIGAYALVLEELLRAIGNASPLHRAIGGGRTESAIAVVKAALLDMELSVSIYFEEAQVERNKAIAAFEAALEALSEGDLTSELSGMPESFARLEKGYNGAIRKLRELIGAVGEGANAISSGASEIMQASENLARRTEANAASLEQTSASLTQVEGLVKATAEGSQKTLARADEALSTVTSGRAVTDSAVTAMGQVAESAQDIDKVIEGLDKIAFQTRVLAMNAAVEAGRAGDAGRGFAVVADLVSALAMRAEEEAKSAREQLTVTQTGITTAVEAVQKVDGALSHISTGVGEVHQLLGSMAQDNEAQSAALSQVSVAIGEMDKATQQNAAMVEETSAAARSLSSEVDILADHAGRFNVGRTDGRPASGRALAVQSAARAPAERSLPTLAWANGKAKAVANGGAQANDWNDF